MSWARNLVLLFIIIGLADSVYLTAVHYTKLPLYCPEGGLINCEQVTTSSFSEVAGIPIAIGGLVWFGVLGAVVFIIRRHHTAFINIWVILALGAVSYSLVGQAILGEICLYCGLLDALLILTSFVILKHKGSVYQ